MRIRNIFLMAFAGLVAGGLIGFFQPLLMPGSGDEVEAVDLATYVQNHPLQGSCTGTETFTVTLFWSLPKDATVNNLFRADERSGAAPIFKGKAGRATAFSEYVDTDVIRGTTYVYHFETDGGLQSNNVTITADQKSCKPQ